MRKKPVPVLAETGELNFHSLFPRAETNSFPETLPCAFLLGSPGSFTSISLSLGAVGWVVHTCTGLEEQG